MIDIRATLAAIERLFARHRNISDTESRRQTAHATLKTTADSVRECERRHYQYFEEIYYTEEKRRDAFTTSASFLIGVLAIAGTIGSFYLRDIIDWIPGTTFTALLNDWTAALYLLLLLVDFVCLAAASYFLIKMLHGYTYQYLAGPLDIRQHYKNLIQYYGNPMDAEVEFQRYLTDQYAAAANTNDQNNITRRKYQYRSVASTISLFVLLALTLVPFVGHRLFHREKQPVLIKWENAHLTIDALPADDHSSLFFDKQRPAVPPYFDSLQLHATQSEPATETRTSTGETGGINTTESPKTESEPSASPSSTTPIHKSFLQSTDRPKR